MTSKTYHLEAPPGETEYIVWHEYLLICVDGDDASQIRIPRVQIDAYSQTDGPLDSHTFFGALLDALDGLQLPYAMQDYGWDHDAAALRLIIQCDVA